MDLWKVHTIRDFAFSGCSKLLHINFKNSGIIGNYAFQSCSNLVSVIFGKVIVIGNCAFYNCVNLEYIMMPKVREIQSNAFQNCEKLRNVYISDELILLPNYPFYEADVYVLAENNLIISRLISAHVPKHKIFVREIKSEINSFGKPKKRVTDHEMHFNRMIRSKLHIN